MKKIKLLALLMIFTGLSSGVNAKDVGKIACEAKHTLYHDNFEIKATYRFVMGDNTGVILINGTAHYGADKYAISREVYYNYKKQSGNDYLLTSQRVYTNPIDTLPDLLAQHHYPSFFLTENKKLNFRINPVNQTDYIISFVSTPLFYCNGE